MPAASFYPLIAAYVLPPLVAFAALRLCWFFGSRFGLTKNALFLGAAVLLLGLILLAIWTLTAVDWRATVLWIRVPAIVGLYFSAIIVTSLLWLLIAGRDRLLASPTDRSNWLTGLSFGILVLATLFVWEHGFEAFDLAPLASTSVEMLSMRRFDLVSAAVIVIAFLAFDEARRFADRIEASGVSSAWRIGLAGAFLSVFGNIVGARRLPVDDLTWFAARRAEWRELSDYQLDRFLGIAETIWQRDAIGSLALLSIAMLTLFHVSSGSRLAANHLRAIGAMFIALSVLLFAGFAVAYPGTEFARDVILDHRLSLLVGIGGGATLGVLMPGLIDALARLRRPALVDVVTPPWLILSIAALGLVLVKMAMPRSAATGHGYVTATAIQFGVLAFATLWAVRHGMRGRAGDTVAKQEFGVSEQTAIP